ncbi:WD40 repeat domain-containing protein [Sphingobacterium rhinopitheci]|nr:WD40 repeat domain-containing protein [Sphingobacterium rhinopitheci]
MNMEVNLRSTLVGHQNPIYTVAIDAAKKVLYSAGNDKGIVEWDLATGVFKRVLCTVASSVYCLLSIPQSEYLFAGLRNGELLVIEGNENVALKARLKVEKGAIFALQYLANKNELLAIGEQGKAYVWDVATFDLLYQFEISKTTVRSISLSPDGKTIAFGDKDGIVYLYDSHDFHLIAHKKIHEGGVSSLAFVGGYLLSGGRDAKLNKLDMSTLLIVDTIVPHMFTVYGIQPLGNSLLSTISRDKTIKIWNTELKLLKNISRDKGIESHFLSINTQCFDPALNVIATAGDDKVIKIWQLS